MGKTKKVKPVRKTAQARVECKAGSGVCRMEKNLKKLARPGNLKGIVKKKGCWDNQTCLVLICE